MIIKLVPETDEEKNRLSKLDVVIHENVKEYFIIGNKEDKDGSIIDFHEWKGSFKFLIGNLSYFYEIVNDDRRKSSMQGESEMQSRIGNSQRVTPMVKRSMGGNIQQIDISKLRNQSEQVEPTNVTEDEFVDENPPTLTFQPDVGEPQAEDVEFAAENIAKQLKREEGQLKNKQGLRIIP